METYRLLDQKHYLNTYQRFPVTLVKGLGSKVWDSNGHEYIDALSGIAVNNLGHCHPKVVKAIQDQAAQLIHISNFYLSKPQALLAAKLTELSGLDRSFFTNSGAESVEGAVKIARKYSSIQGKGSTVIHFSGSFHGRTLATIAMGKKSMQQGFEPIPSGFTELPLNDTEAALNAIGDDIAAVIIEPIQGEGGIHAADKQFLKALRYVCTKHGAVLIYDEIQCGMGRTGYFLAKDHYGIQPDIITLAKGLGGGVPIGAVLVNEKVASAIVPGDHGTTFGGNPLVCAAALAVLEELTSPGFLHEVTRKGQLLTKLITELNEPSIIDIRGLGLMIGIAFEFETKALVMEMFKRGVLANATSGNVLRLLPALNIPDRDLEAIVKILKQSLQAVKAKANV